MLEDTRSGQTFPVVRFRVEEEHVTGQETVPTQFLNMVEITVLVWGNHWTLKNAIPRHVQLMETIPHGRLLVRAAHGVEMGNK